MPFSFPKFLQLAILIVVLAIAACAGAPVQEMSNARQAVAAARQMGAEHAAAKEMAEAESLLQTAQAALDRGEYGTARADAMRARAQALKALHIAQQQAPGGHASP